MLNKIEKIFAEEIKDSRGNPAIKVTVLAGGVSGEFAVPSGASVGGYEAFELRDADPFVARGLGVSKAIHNVNEIIAKALLGEDVKDQKRIDRILIELDGSKNKRKLGGNAIIGASIACAKAAAKTASLQVFEYLKTLAEIEPSRRAPYLFMNLINGGKHAENALAFQEYHVVPATDDIGEAIDIGLQIQNSLKEIILENLGSESLAMGDEGGFAPKIADIRKPLQFLSEAIARNGLQGKVRLALDVAASSFYKDGLYEVGGKNITKEELMEIYRSMIEEFGVFSIEDPFFEDDFESFKNVKNANPGLLVVGDDLTVTNHFRLREAIARESINAMIIKPNQIGTLSETLETMKLARENGIDLIVSHRSGETDDDFIADLAYAFGCFGLKAGAPGKRERRIKYDRLKSISVN